MIQRSCFQQDLMQNPTRQHLLPGGPGQALYTVQGAAATPSSEPWCVALSIGHDRASRNCQSRTFSGSETELGDVSLDLAVIPAATHARMLPHRQDLPTCALPRDHRHNDGGCPASLLKVVSTQWGPERILQVNRRRLEAREICTATGAQREKESGYGGRQGRKIDVHRMHPSAIYRRITRMLHGSIVGRAVVVGDCLLYSASQVFINEASATENRRTFGAQL